MLSKEKRDPELPFAYRPLFVRSRQAEMIRVVGDLSPRQLGFSAGRSTVIVVIQLLVHQVDDVHHIFFLGKVG